MTDTKMSDVFDLPLVENGHGDISEVDCISSVNAMNRHDAKAIVLAVNHHDNLVETLNDLLNDCINFDGGKLSDCYMKQASDLLQAIKGDQE